MNANEITNRLTNFINWAIGRPFEFLLWFSAVVVVVGLGFTTLNGLAGLHLPTLGFNPTTSVYIAGIVYLLQGKV